MTNIVIYARFSSHNQNEQSIEGQLKACRDFAKQNDYIVTHEYIDRAISGTTDKRPEFLRRIEDSKQKHFEYILVYQLDRFARNRYDSAMYKARLKKVVCACFRYEKTFQTMSAVFLSKGYLKVWLSIIPPNYHKRFEGAWI